MTAARGRIIAMAGGGFTMEPDNPRLDDHVLAATGSDHPSVLFVPTASGDSPGYVQTFHDVFAGRADTDALSLFNREGDLREPVFAADLVYVGGGNTANLIALWRLHGLDALLREACAKGVVLTGVSAGALCWFESGVTDSFGPGLAPLTGGLGFLDGAFCPHYDSDPARRPTLHRLVGDGTLPDAWAADDGCALEFVDGALVDVIASRPGARAYRITREAGGRVIEREHPARLLGSR
jgi:dipeptidase E